MSAAAPSASSFGSLKEAAAPDGAGEQNFDPDGEEHRWGLRNSGAVRQPFPDVCMCLTMIWYMTDGNERTGGTWIVPGSHRDHRNPRGPHDGMTVSAPM